MFSFLKGSKKTKESDVKEEKEKQVVVEEIEEEYSIIFLIIKKDSNKVTGQTIDNSNLFFKLLKNQFIRNQIFNHCKLYKQYSKEKYQVQDYKEFCEVSNKEINQYISELEFKKVDPFLGVDKCDIKIPRSIKSISFSLDKQTFKDIPLPTSITTLTIGKYPKQVIIESNDIPKHITKLILEQGFENQRTYSKTKYISTIQFIPSTVKSLVINTTNFGTRVGEIPKTITNLDIGLSGHSRVFDKGYLPTGDSSCLVDIKIGNCMNSQILTPGDIPKSVKLLRFNNGFDQILKKGIIPSGVTKVLFDKGSHFNCPLESGSFPSSVTEIKFGSSFNQEIKQGELPIGLEYLNLGHYFNRDFVLPSTLKTLILSINFNSPLSIGVFPSTLEYLDMGNEFNKPIPKGVIPSNVTHLKVSRYFEQQLKPGDLPNSIKTLIFGGLKLNESMVKAIPSSVTHLQFEYLPTTIHSYTSLIQPISTTLNHLEYFYTHDENPIDFTKLPNGLKVIYSNDRSPKTIIINN